MNRSAARLSGSLTVATCTLFISASILVGQAPSGSTPGTMKKTPPLPSTAQGKDLRLVEAVAIQDMQAVRSLLEQHTDVNTPQGDGATALEWAAYWDDLETADQLIGLGANVNAANDYGVTPLSLACTNRSAAMVEILLNAGANANAALWTGETPLMTCARTGNIDALKSLLSRGVDVNARETLHGQTALMWAVSEKHANVTRALVERGADVRVRSKGSLMPVEGCLGTDYSCRKDVGVRLKGFTPLLFAAQHGDLESARILLAAGADVNEATPEDGSALVIASANGHQELAIFLLDKGADPNISDDTGMTALHNAVIQGVASIVGVRKLLQVTSYLFRPNMPELIKALLAHGANPNAPLVKMPRFINTKGQSINPVGATPFLAAAVTCDVKIMSLLAAGGADPLLATEDGVTPLMTVAGAGTQRNYYTTQLFHTEPISEEERHAVEAAKLLVELGVDVNATDNSGSTALHFAAHDGADAIIQYLVEKGAKLDIEDRSQRTALSIASEGDLLGPHKSTVALLLKLGATAR